MKKLLFISLAALLCSCKKEYVEPAAPPIEQKPYFLDFSGSTVNVAGLKQVSCKDLYSGSTDVGDLPRFEQDDFIFQIAIEGDSLADFAMGVIEGNSFILNCDSGYMNICNGGQNVPVSFRVYQ